MATTATLGGAPGATLVRCNRCGGSGRWVSPTGSNSGICYACHGGGLLEQERAEKYLSRHRAPATLGEPSAQALAYRAKARAEELGWAMGDPVTLSDRVELLGRNPRRPGRTVHLTWELESLQRHQEWLEGPPSKHRDLLTEDA